MLRFDFEVHTSALTDARGNAITSFKLIENDDTGKELTPHELAALEKAYKRDADQDGNFGVGMAASPIDQKGGLQLANALGVSFLMASKRAVSSARSPLDLSTAFTLSRTLTAREARGCQKMLPMSQLQHTPHHHR